MGLPFVEVVEGRVGIANERLFCVVKGAKFLLVVDVGSWCLSC